MRRLNKIAANHDVLLRSAGARKIRNGPVRDAGLDKTMQRVRRSLLKEFAGHRELVEKVVSSNHGDRHALREAPYNYLRFILRLTLRLTNNGEYTTTDTMNSVASMALINPIAAPMALDSYHKWFHPPTITMKRLLARYRYAMDTKRRIRRSLATLIDAIPLQAFDNLARIVRELRKHSVRSATPYESATQFVLYQLLEHTYKDGPYAELEDREQPIEHLSVQADGTFAVVCSQRRTQDAFDYVKRVFPNKQYTLTPGIVMAHL